jgi:hypothetical protein
MKIEKSFELLNAEGPIIKIERIDGFWHYKFHTSKGHTITSPKEILDAIWNNKAIVDTYAGKVYFLDNYPLSMKGDDPKYYAAIVECLLNEELAKSSKDPEYFKKTYMRL